MGAEPGSFPKGPARGTAAGREPRTARALVLGGTCCLLPSIDGERELGRPNCFASIEKGICVWPETRSRVSLASASLRGRRKEAPAARAAGLEQTSELWNPKREGGSLSGGGE